MLHLSTYMVASSWHMWRISVQWPVADTCLLWFLSFFRSGKVYTVCRRPWREAPVISVMMTSPWWSCCVITTTHVTCQTATYLGAATCLIGQWPLKAIILANLLIFYLLGRKKYFIPVCCHWFEEHNDSQIAFCAMQMSHVGPHTIFISDDKKQPNNSQNETKTKQQ